MTELTQADIDKAVQAVRDELGGDIEALKSKNADLVREKRELQKTSQITPEQLAAVETERDDLRTKLAASEKATKDATAAAEKATKALEAETGFTSRLLIQDGVKSALIAAGVKDEDYIDTLTAKFASGAQVVTEGDSRVAKVGDKALADFIKEWAGSDAGKKFVEAPANGGGGATGGSGGPAGENPFAKGSVNVTEQMRIAKTDPAKAQALAKAAGVELTL